MTRLLYPDEYRSYLLKKMRVIFSYNHYEGWLKKGKQDIFICSGDTIKEVMTDAVDIIRTMVSDCTVYEVVV